MDATLFPVLKFKGTASKSEIFAAYQDHEVSAHSVNLRLHSATYVYLLVSLKRHFYSVSVRTAKRGINIQRPEKHKVNFFKEKGT